MDETIATQVQIGFRGLRVSCVIGVRDHERARAQDLLVDLDLWYDATKAVQSDDLQAAIDYSELARFVEQQLIAGRFALLERAAWVTAEAVLKHATVARRVVVTLRKPAAIGNANCALVRVERKKE